MFVLTTRNTIYKSTALQGIIQKREGDNQALSTDQKKMHIRSSLFGRKAACSHLTLFDKKQREVRANDDVGHTQHNQDVCILLCNTSN